MNTKVKNTYFTGVPAWALSLISSIVTLIFMFVLADILSSIMGEDDGEALAYVIFDSLIAIFCFLICWKYPKSYWYVPIISNMVGIVSAFVEPTFWETSLWKYIVAGWVLSILASLLGRYFGLKK